MKRELESYLACTYYMFDEIACENIKERLDFLNILIFAVENFYDIYAIILSSKNRAELKKKLMEKYKLKDYHAQAIIDMRIRGLVRDEKIKLEKEYEEVIVRYRRISGKV